MNLDGRSNRAGMQGGHSIVFYRTDADRRPAQPCLRPNDSPGDWTVRARLAEEARVRADRKRITLDRPMTAVERAREQRDEQRRSVLKFVASAPFGVDQRNMADRLGLPFSAISKFVLELVATGLVETEITGRVGRGQSISVTATEAGADQAEAQPQ